MTKNKKLIIGISTASAILVPTIAIPTAILLSKKDKKPITDKNLQDDESSNKNNYMPSEMASIDLDKLFENKELGLIITNDSKPTSKEIIDALKSKYPSIDSSIFESLKLEETSNSKAKFSSNIKEKYLGVLEVSFQIQTKSQYKEETKKELQSLWAKEFKGKLTTTQNFSEILEAVISKSNRKHSKLSLKDEDSKKEFYSIYKERKKQKEEKKEKEEEKEKEQTQPSTFNLQIDGDELQLEIGEISPGKKATKYLDNRGNIKSTYDRNLKDLDSTEILEIGFYHDSRSDEFVITSFPKNVKKLPKKLPTLITSLEGAFRDLESENVDGIDEWDTSNITNMESVFERAKKFSGDISKWKTEKVKSFSNMFSFAEKFNGKLSDWNTNNVENMRAMFYNAKNFNQDISKWKTEKVTDMSWMFNNAQTFNHSINDWNTSKVKNMSRMFENALQFNQELNKWKTESVTDMSYMFYGAVKFNKPIGNWDTKMVESMAQMFHNAKEFNQEIKNWNTDKLTKNYQYYKFAEGSMIHDNENHLPNKLKDKVKKMRVSSSRNSSRSAF
ncbi:BspA family leucine-rich repeat surface protein [Metamycoplasma auris]|uniref:Surface protein n=1 Tax=Metamycoplasma auris TaxID=51363 RepID=A0A2W7G4Q1_9BACT|nr:BspA family leucine-rich repeat surface protein [Metamycoplasma auris]PZW01562.1 surface protein [Metamycoplasma auris]